MSAQVAGVEHSGPVQPGEHTHENAAPPAAAPAPAPPVSSVHVPYGPHGPDAHDDTCVTTTDCCYCTCNVVPLQALHATLTCWQRSPVYPGRQTHTNPPYVS